MSELPDEAQASAVLDGGTYLPKVGDIIIRAEDAHLWLRLDSPETVERLARALRDITGAGDYVGVTDEEWSRRAARVLAALREGTA